jgi:hypothetical protein
MANTLNTGVYKEEWEARLQQRLNAPLSWKEVCDVIYSDVKIFNVPYMSTSFSSASLTRGTAYTYSDFTLTNETLDIATGRVCAVLVDEADKSQCQYVSQMETADRQASILNEYIETGVLDDHASWTDVGLSGGVITSEVTTAITVDSSNIDAIIRGVRRIVNVANGLELASQNGLFIVWRSADFEYLEEFAQKNGFNLADTALKNGIQNGFYFMGCYHYITNNNVAGHVFAGVRKLMKLGILNATYGKVKLNEDPGLVSGTGMVSRIDFGTLVPTGLASLLLDINVA